MTRINSERRTAIHEAGHAVVNVFAGRFPAYATIIPERESLGHVRYEMLELECGEDPTTDHLLLVMVSALAGQAAERHANFKPRRHSLSADHQLAASAAEKLSADPQECALWLRLAEHRAKAAVALYWSPITAVADRLILTKRIEGSELVALVRSAT